MVHILLLILKIIGIILLIIVGVLLLAVAMVLFVPVRYRLSADYHKHFKTKIHIGWLFDIIRINMSYDEEMDIKARALFFALYDSNKQQDYPVEKDMANSDKKTEYKKEKNVFDEKQAKKVYDDNVTVTESVNHKKEALTKKPEIKTDIKLADETGTCPVKKTETDKTIKDSDAGHGRRQEKEESTDSRIAVLINKVKNIFNKIKLRTANVIKTKNKLKTKIDKVKAIVEDEANKEMVSFLLEQFKLFLCEIKPVKYDINIHYGCDDPYITGKILIYASIFYGLSGLDMNITPDFSREIIEGNIYLKGRIRIYKLLLIAFRVYRNDRFRKLILKR